MISSNSWTEIPTNTQLEYSVKAFGKTYKVDYALIIEGTPVAFIEAKGVDTPLTDNHREKLEAYLKNEDVNLGILTNGIEYEFFRRQVVDSKVNVNTLATARLRDLPERVTILRAFTKDAIQNDEWVKILNRIKELQEARATLETKKDDLAAELTELLTDNVSEAVATPAESQTKEMIDRLIRDIEQEIDSDGVVSSSEREVAISSQKNNERPDINGEYVIEIVDDTSAPATFSDDNQSEVMAEAVNYLVEKHDLISDIEPLPYIPGRSKVLIHDQSTYPDGEKEMRQPHELTGDYYLDTHNHKAGKKRDIQRLVEKCGLEVLFKGQW